MVPKDPKEAITMGMIDVDYGIHRAVLAIVEDKTFLYESVEEFVNEALRKRVIEVRRNGNTICSGGK